MKTKKIEKYSAEYWREREKERRMTDKLDREHYERRINYLLDMVSRGKESLDYDPNLVKAAARAWMYMNRNRDSLHQAGRQPPTGLREDYPHLRGTHQTNRHGGMTYGKDI